MSARFFPVAAAATAAAVVLTRWPFRAHYLTSWDSANYALAMDRIDIAAHRPHPPGYLGYVMAARGLDALLHDPNAALVLWNIVCAALVAVLVLRMAWDIALDQPRPGAFVAAAVSLVVTSPLLWFYSDVAEIYPSELLGTLAVGFCAWRSLRGDRRALYQLAVALPLAAIFKLTAALFMLPLAVYALWRASRSDRWRASALLVVCGLGSAAFLLASAPGLLDIIWNQFVTSTSSSRVVGGGTDLLERLSRNARDTVTAGVSTFGIVNVLAMIAWLALDRRLPSGIDWRTAVLWAGPFLVLCVFVHIGKPGYLLPVLPVGALIVAGFYGRMRPAVAASLVVAQAVGSIAQFTVFGPLPDYITGGPRAYREKTFAQRMASDLQLLAFATAAVIRETDESMRRVLTTVERVCPSMDPVIIVALDPVDARRLMWYLPVATIVHTEERSVRAIARSGTFRASATASDAFETACPVLWLAADQKPPQFELPADAVREAGVGFVISARRVGVTPTAIVFE